MNKWVFSLMLFGLAFGAKCDVPERPDFCARTACVSITQSSANIESSTTHFDDAKNEEQIWIWLDGGVTIGLHVSGPIAQSKCVDAVDRIPISYPPNRPGRGCRFITANVMLSNGELSREYLEALEISVWGVEEFPNGSWEEGIAQRIGPAVPLCVALLQKSRASLKRCK
jgi:hypothetical protein